MHLHGRTRHLKRERERERERRKTLFITLEENASTHLNEISVTLREILGENRFSSSLFALLFKVMINIKDNLLKALTPPPMKITMMETWTVLYITH